MANNRFVDRCDICHKPKYCRGYKNMVLCEECIGSTKNSLETQKINKKQDVEELTIFSFIEVSDE